MLKNLRAGVTALSTGHVSLHADVFCLDNSKTCKEGVARTYHGYDGYAPVGAYLGEEGWCIGLDCGPVTSTARRIFSSFSTVFCPAPGRWRANGPC